MIYFRFFFCFLHILLYFCAHGGGISSFCMNVPALALCICKFGLCAQPATVCGISIVALI